MNTIFEKEYVDIEDLFAIKSFERTAMLVFRNTINRKSKWDLSRYITDNHPHIILKQNLNKHNYQRMTDVLLNQDPKTTVDIISIFVRLYDEDVNTESIIGEDVINKINDLILERGYDKLYIETDTGFTYDWLNDVKLKDIQLIGEYFHE